MDFNLSSEQEQLRSGARRFVSERLDFENRRQRLAADRDCWADFAEMGWLMLAVPEEADGLASPLEDMAILAEELGRGVAIEPFIASAVLPARLMALADPVRCREWLRALATGEARFAAAIHETERRYALDGFATLLNPDGGNGWILDGSKPLVFGGAQADYLIVAACAPDEARPCLVVVDTRHEGVTIRPYRTIDGLSAADIRFDAVPAEAVIAGADAATDILDRALAEATVLQCADAVGCADRAIELTAGYLHTRTQFGQPLAAFQALQHGVANLFVEANDARSMVYRAIAACASSEQAGLLEAVSACKIRVMEAVRTITGQAVHFHGGIGMTCEYPVGEYLRRTLVQEQWLGNSQYHFERYMAGLGRTGDLHVRHI